VFATRAQVRQRYSPRPSIPQTAYGTLLSEFVRVLGVSLAPVTHVEFLADTGALPMIIPETPNTLVGNITVVQTRKGEFR
jgi:hypothetical protein